MQKYKTIKTAKTALKIKDLACNWRQGCAYNSLHHFIDSCRDIMAASDGTDPNPYVVARFLLVSASGSERLVLHECQTEQLVDTFDPSWPVADGPSTWALESCAIVITEVFADHPKLPRDPPVAKAEIYKQSDLASADGV